MAGLAGMNLFSFKDNDSRDAKKEDTKIADTNKSDNAGTDTSGTKKTDSNTVQKADSFSGMKEPTTDNKRDEFVVNEVIDANAQFMSLFGRAPDSEQKEDAHSVSVPVRESKQSEKAPAQSADVANASIFFEDKPSENTKKDSDNTITFRDNDEVESEGLEKFVIGSDNSLREAEAVHGFTANTEEVPIVEDTEEGSASGDTETQASTEQSSGEEQCEQSSGDEQYRQGTFPAIIFRQPNFLVESMDDVKYWKLRKKFEKGTVVQQIDKNKKPIMLLLQVDTDLMAYRYLGSSLEVEIPAFVGNRPVKHVHPTFLTGGANLFTGIKMQNVKGMFGIDNLADLSMTSLKTAFKGIKSLVLPNGLLALPPKLLVGCAALDSIVIPSSVTAVSTKAFMGCSIKDIYFNGRCPQGLRNNYLLHNGVRIHYKAEYSKEFEEVMK